MPQKKDLLALGLLAGLTTVFFSPVLLSNFTFGYGDIHRYFYPLRSFTAGWIKEGIFPLWNPYLLTGIPNLASLQPAVLYPLSVFTYLFPFPLGFKLFVACHFFLASSLMYLLMRGWGVAPAAAFISGITYGFGGYLLSVVDMLTTLSSASWTPLVFIFFTRTLDHRRLTYTILTGLALALQFLGGEPTVLYATLMVLLAFSLVRAITDFSPWPLVLLALSALAGLALILFQVLPFLEMVSLSSRNAGLAYKHVVSLALAPHELLNLLFPFFSGNFIQEDHFWFGQSWLESIYAGILPLFLTLLAIFRAKSLLVWFWAIVLIGSVLFSFGDRLPIYSFCYHFLPGFSMIRYPVKFFSYAAFAMALLAGFGYNYLLSRIEKKTGKYLFISFSLTLIYFILWFLGDFKEEAIISLVKNTYFPTRPPGIIANWYHQLLGNILLIGYFLAGITLSFYLIRKRLVDINVLSVVLIGLLISDLFIFGSKINPVLPQSLYTDKPAALKFIQQDSSCYRIFLEPQTERFYRIIRGRTLEEALIGVQRFLVPNSGVLHGLFDAGGYESLSLNNYTRFLKQVEKSPRLLNLINVKYIISRQGLNIEGLKLIFHQQGVMIYANQHFLARAFFVPRVLIIKDREEILKRLTSSNFDPGQQVILEEDFKSQISNLKFSRSKAQVVEYQPNKVVLNTFCPDNACLFLSDNYYPGWKAYIDGKRTKIYRANFTFRAIFVPEGTKRVEFVYSPWSFKIGLIASSLVLLGLITAANKQIGVRH